MGYSGDYEQKEVGKALWCSETPQAATKQRLSCFCQ
jgi:hypothetical protein